MLALSLSALARAGIHSGWAEAGAAVRCATEAGAGTAAAAAAGIVLGAREAVHGATATGAG